MMMQIQTHDFDRIPPHSIEAEACFLASVMLDRSIFEESRAIVSEGCFYQADNAVIFACVRDLYERGAAVDAVLVREELIRRNMLEEVGGVKYLAEILNSVPSPAHGLHYAGIMQEKAILRGVLQISNQASESVYCASNDDRAMDIAQSAMARLARLTANAGSTAFVSGGEAGMKVIEAFETKARPLIRLGIDPLDDAMGGIQRGEMVILGARPSMGKSITCRQVLLDAARQGIPTALISLEESREKIARNLLSRIARIDNQSLRKGTFADDDWPRLMEAQSTLASLPIFIADKAFTLPAIRSIASMLVSKHGVQLIIVDYLQRVRAPGKDRYAQVTEASDGLSMMFKELDVAGFVAAQLSRESAKRPNKRPGMADLRESGQIEQDADQIIMLHREDYYRATGESNEGSEPDEKVEFILVKFRDGARGGTVCMRSELRYQSWVPMLTIDDPWSNQAA